MEAEQGGKGKKKKKSLFRLHRFVNGGEMEGNVERPFWKGELALLVLLFSVVVLVPAVIVVVAVCVGLKGRRKG